MPFRCEGSCGCPECVGGLLGPPDDAVGALGGAKLARNRQNASISLVGIPGQKIPPKSRLGPSHGVHLIEAALRSHGRRACRLVPGRSRWTSRTNGRPLRCFGCGNWPSRRRRGCPSWRQDFECLPAAPARRHAQPFGDRDLLAHRWPRRCAISRTATRVIINGSRSVLEPLASRGL